MRSILRSSNLEGTNVLIVKPEDPLMGKNEIVFFIDKQQFTTDREKLTATELLRDYAEEDPSETTLVLKEGNNLTKFNDNDEVSLKNGMHFVVFHDGPTTVSNYGPDRLVEELISLGYVTELLTASDKNKYAILKKFIVPVGKFSDREIDLGLLATSDFPISVTSAIHVLAHPQLFEKSDTVANVRNITDSVLGSDWRYWSVNFNWKKGSSARRLVSQINAVFQNA